MPRTLLFAGVVLGLAGGAPAAAATLDHAIRPVLVIGPDGLGLFAYYDPVAQDLKVGHCVDSACSAVTTTTVDSTGDVGKMADLAIGPGGPVISYADVTNQRLKLAQCADPLCAVAATVVVDLSLTNPYGYAGFTSIAVGTDGRPLIAYGSGTPTSRLKTAHCDNADCSAVTVTDHADGGGQVSLAIGGDGRGFLAYIAPITIGSVMGLRHCADVACTATSTAIEPVRLPSTSDGFPTVAIGPDGFPRVFWLHEDTFGGGGFAHLRRCLDPVCGTSTTGQVPAAVGAAAFALGANDRPHIVVRQVPYPPGDQLQILECLDATCAAYQDSCLAGLGSWPTVALDGANQPLVGYEKYGQVVITRPGAVCATEMITFDAQGTETLSYPPISFDVTLYPPSTSEVTVGFTFEDGTATGGTGQPGTDYIAYSGSVTFAPGEQRVQVHTTIMPDVLPEVDETFDMVLSGAVNATLVDGRATGTIIDTDNPRVDILDNSCAEGDAGTAACGFEVRLSEPHAKTVTVQFATADGTAVAGSDYVAASGTVTFPPGALAQTATVTILGDADVEPYETVMVNVPAAANAVLGDVQAIGTILDDDAPSLSSIELTHGSRLAADLAAAPGPVADRDFYRLAQGPYSSWEIVADQVSGDVAPGLVLERLAEDNSTVLQTGTPAGTGGASVLRWQRRAPTPENRQHISVRSTSCTTDCGPDDTYRLRVYQTTGVIPRFNNAGSQSTVLVLQNTTDQEVAANADFWAVSGALLATAPVTLPPHAVSVLGTSAIPGLAGKAGSITVTHDGPYGGLAGKAVAVEPSTGLSFDSPMETRPR